MKNPSNYSSATSSSTLYEAGVFTTIAILSGVPLFWKKHWARLERDAAKVGVDMSAFDENRVFEGLEQTLKNDGVRDGRARITFLDERSGDIWPAETVENTSMSIITGGRRNLPSKFSLTASPYRVNTYSPLVGVKSCNYLENILGLQEARGRGFHEAIRINHEGAMTGGCVSNIYWLQNGLLFTPSLSTGCLSGTTREYVLENLACEEVAEPIDTLAAVEAIFLSSAGLGVVQVNELDNLTFNLLDHPILHLVP